MVYFEEAVIFNPASGKKTVDTEIFTRNRVGHSSLDIKSLLKLPTQHRNIYEM